jgi:hypothetical protein
VRGLSRSAAGANEPGFISDEARMDPLHATIEDFSADGFTHVEANCPRCRVIRLRQINQLSENLDGAHPRPAGLAARSQK